MKIGVFDSGLGGLTVLQKLVSIQPQTEYLYLADTINLPYGEKSEEDLIRFVEAKIAWMAKQKIDLLIIACNTSDSVLLTNEFNNKFPQGVIRIIEPTIDNIILNYPKLQNVACISTSFTAKKNLFGQLLKIKNCTTTKITPIACPNLVSEIENLASKEKILFLLKEYLQPLLVNNYQGLILGCSHYPLITREIRQFLRENNLSNIIIFNPADAIADNFKKKLIKSTKAKITYYTTNIRTKDRLEYYSQLLFQQIFPIHHIEPLC
jgi:glutamate racemase